MKQSVLVTTAIPYVNADPHIGHALEIVQSDSLARFYRQSGYDTYFLWGSDENATKNVEAAEKKNVPTQKLVDENSKKFLNLKSVLNLSFDQFIKTSEARHKKGSQKFWLLCQKDIYKKVYSALYCTGCETFYKDGEFTDNICPRHNRKLGKVSEENYFFKLSSYQSQLKKILAKDEIRIYPSFRKKEVLNFVSAGLEDFSISRPKERTKGWGVPVPGDDSQIMYVWFDALTNYVTALNFHEKDKLFKRYWLENKNIFQVIGKDIVKFHAIYWPAMLLSAGLPLPRKIFVHGFVNIEGRKMSKTIGNIIDPNRLVNKYGTDALRYYLLREIPTFDDGDYSDSRMLEIYNADLANELGNLLIRVTNIAQKDGLQITFSPQKIFTDELVNFFEGFEFGKVLETIWKKLKELNKAIDDFTPWEKIANERSKFLVKMLQELNLIGHQLLPLLPQTGEKIISATSRKIKKAEALFPKE